MNFFGAPKMIFYNTNIREDHIRQSTNNVMDKKRPLQTDSRAFYIPCNAHPGRPDPGDDVCMCVIIREAIAREKCSFFEHCSKGL